PRLIQALMKHIGAIWRHLILGVLALCVCNAAVAEPSERELQITAAYLYHFIQFTEWPEKPSVFHYCVYDNEGFANLLRKIYSDKTVGDASIDVNNINDNASPDACHLIYFSQTAPAVFLQKISQYAVLSVGSQKNFIELGGIIYLFEADQKLRFYINNTAAKDTGLTISSQLLKLSREP
ncbi:MAG: YfiR family protein, partial [Methylobacter sp.]